MCREFLARETLKSGDNTRISIDSFNCWNRFYSYLTSFCVSRLSNNLILAKRCSLLFLYASSIERTMRGCSGEYIVMWIEMSFFGQFRR